LKRTNGLLNRFKWKPIFVEQTHLIL